MCRNIEMCRNISEKEMRIKFEMKNQKILHCKKKFKNRSIVYIIVYLRIVTKINSIFDRKKIKWKDVLSGSWKNFKNFYEERLADDFTITSFSSIKWQTYSCHMLPFSILQNNKWLECFDSLKTNKKRRKKIGVQIVCSTSLCVKCSNKSCTRNNMTIQYTTNCAI